MVRIFLFYTNKEFAKDMNVRPTLLTSLINEVCEAVGNVLDGLIAEHKKNYGKAKIYKELNEIIKSNTIHLQSFFSYGSIDFNVL